MRHRGEDLPKEKILNFKIYIIYKNLKVRIYILTRRIIKYHFGVLSKT